MNNEIKPVEELEFSDDFMFYRVMQDADICKGVLECLLGIRIARVQKKELQKTLKPYYGAKGIRLDVYAADENRVFDVEMQKITRSDLPRRARYYQSLLDADALVAGADYTSLKDSFVVFICLNDPFTSGRPVYTYKKCCLEDKNIVLQDGAATVFFNADAFAQSQDLALLALLRYIKTQETQDTLTQKIAGLVHRLKENEIFKGDYMRESLALLDARKLGYDEGVEWGISQGIARGMQQGIAQGRSEGMQQGLAKGVAQGVSQGKAEFTCTQCTFTGADCKSHRAFPFCRARATRTTAITSLPKSARGGW